MPNNKKKSIAKNCEICARPTRDERFLGPFIETKTIAAHYNCVYFNPVIPDKVDIAANGIGGVSSRFIRNEGKRAKPLVHTFLFIFFLHFVYRSFFPQICVYCKRGGANIGCCRDIGSDTVLKFCSRRYHVNCGLQKGASFTVTANCGTVSLCFEHRDQIEK